MKRLLQILAALVVITIIGMIVLLAPRFRNMSSEYGTAQAIRDLKDYVAAHEGQWPSHPDDLGGSYPTGGDVVIDYTISSGEIVGHRELLKTAVRPRSGKFYTYPHYDELLDELYAIVLEESQSEQGVGGQPATRPRVGD
ncbi:hypothetical protein HAHE_24430 [Haloferula helveola]|uniref:Uncharacterized protein n=1 Tax=Haloferula helveola TaxID=490095 RepID=A0ABM7RGR7_9BACT|nr:hypothetical protein HAHE_24430 [Haloferula helveola]